MVFTKWVVRHQVDTSPSPSRSEELRRRGLRRDALTFHAAASTSASRWRRASELLMEMRRQQMRLEVVSYTLAGATGKMVFFGWVFEGKIRGNLYIEW